MSMLEPGFPHFWERQPNGWETTAGVFRVYPITHDSPHEPWCHHFEWGGCNCGPQDGEVFCTTQTTEPPEVFVPPPDRPVVSGRGRLMALLQRLGGSKDHA